MLPLSQSMRKNYANGVDQYYSQHASSSYRNPHYPGIVKTLHAFLDIYAAKHIDSQSAENLSWRVLDLAAGSGEATEAVYTWLKKRSQSHNPKRVMPKISITATDPYTGPAYLERTGLTCLPLSFADIASGKLPETPSPYDLVVISFALHLLTETSQLWSLLSTLADRARYLVVLAPHKKPAIKPEWGWTRVDPWSLEEVDSEAPSDQKQVGGKRGDGYEIYDERVRLRVWKSNHYVCSEDDSGDDRRG
jgi:hypothetical protein